MFWSTRLRRGRNLSLVIAILIFAQVSCFSKTTRPNIVFILTDDLGIGEANAQSPEWGYPINPLAKGGGSPLKRNWKRPQQILKTPNLVRFAQAGMRAIMSYAPASLCTPSRASIMLGRGVGSTGIGENQQSFELTDYQTFPSKIRDLGYRTAYFGKWGLGDFEGGPWNHGFDIFVGQTNNIEAHCVFPSFLTWYNASVHARPTTPENVLSLRRVIPANDQGLKFNSKNCPSNPAAVCVYSNDIFRDVFMDFLSTQSENMPPFLAIWAPTYPHFASYNEHQPSSRRFEAATRRYSRPASRSLPEFFRGHAGRIEAHLDVDIGMFLDLLEARPGLDSSTLVIFSSDNGPPSGLDFFKSYGGLRGSKRNIFESGVRVPTMVRWNGVIPPATVSRTPFALYELADMFTQLAAHSSTFHPLLSAWATGEELPSRPPMLLKTCAAIVVGGVIKGYTCQSATYDLSQWQTRMLKLITMQSGLTILFNLVNDPKEKRALHNRDLSQSMMVLRDSMDNFPIVPKSS